MKPFHPIGAIKSRRCVCPDHGVMREHSAWGSTSSCPKCDRLYHWFGPNGWRVWPPSRTPTQEELLARMKQIMRKYREEIIRGPKGR